MVIITSPSALDKANVSNADLVIGVTAVNQLIFLHVYFQKN